MPQLREIAMDTSKLKFEIAFVVLTALLASSTEAVNAHNADLTSGTLAAAQTAKQQCINTCPCALSRLSSPELDTVVRMPGCLPGLHAIQLYWSGTGMNA
jgi:hypothetical protein